MTAKQPLVSIDVVPVRFNRKHSVLEFATGRRIFEPFLDHQALPGVLLGSGESISDAATRALESKVGLPSGISRQLGAFDSTDRDPRGASISIAIISIQDSNATSPQAFWHSNILKLPFDHEAIVASAMNKTRQAIWNDVEFTRGLLGESFTTADATAISSPTPLASNAKRWFETWPYVRRVNGTVKKGAVGRPATTWEWVN